MAPLSLDNLTVLGTTPVEMLAIAERLGFDAISPIALPSARVNLAIQPLHRGSTAARALGERLRDSPVHIHNMDGFTIHPDVDRTVYWDTIELSAELGAERIVTLLFDPEHERGFDTFCRLCERCASHGIGVGLEFMALSQVRDMAAADAYLHRADQPNAQILVDFFHLLQSGGTATDLTSIDPGRICSAQICDGAAGMTMEAYAYNAVNDRKLPGEGEMPIAQILAALPRGVMVGVEIPHRAMTEAGVSPYERARIALAATRAAFTDAS